MLRLPPGLLPYLVLGLGPGLLPHLALGLRPRLLSYLELRPWSCLPLLYLGPRLTGRLLAHLL
ncbi:MAG: hypothetical protein P8X58_11965 [Syntrophobacterales bacterium]